MKEDWHRREGGESPGRERHCGLFFFFNFSKRGVECSSLYSRASYLMECMYVGCRNMC